MQQNITDISPIQKMDHFSLNALLSTPLENGGYNTDADRKATKAYFLNHVNENMRFFHSLEEKLDYLVENGYYEKRILDAYTPEQVKDLFKRAYKYKFRFSSFLGAFKFYTSYALKSTDGQRYLERFEDRVCMTALTLAISEQHDVNGPDYAATSTVGNIETAKKILDEIMQRRFQPATPTFLNCGKARRGEFVSCFLLRVEDNMNSISRAINSSLQLSKLGGGVALDLSNLREQGAPIKGIENQASGVVPIMKMLEDAFSYANQLGARDGAGAVYLNVHHPDILDFIDTKRENADEKIRIKTLSLGLVVPDIALKLAHQNKPMYLFSPHDIQKVYGKAFNEISITEWYDKLVDDPNIRKRKIDARNLFQRIAEVQMESGYPYIMFDDVVNAANPIAGRITMSNLCSEILQVNSASTYNRDLSYSHIGEDISCNLGSLNIAETMANKQIGDTVECAIRALTTVSMQSSIDEVPSIAKSNAGSRAIGLGQMNLHGYLAQQKIHYGSPEAVNFTSVYFMTVLYHCLRTSCMLAKEHGYSFDGFEDSKYASGEFFNKYIEVEAEQVDREWQYSSDWYPQSDTVSNLFAGIEIPKPEHWQFLRQEVMTYGLFNRNLQAVPPTGSISYINHATASIHPITAPVEIRKEGKIGRLYYPAPNLNEETAPYYRDAYQIGYKSLIDTYAAATQHVDQGLSCTIFLPDKAVDEHGLLELDELGNTKPITTRHLNKVHVYARKKGLKTLYYVRFKQMTLEEEVAFQECQSCTL